MKRPILALGSLVLAGAVHAAPIISDTSWDGDSSSLQCLFNGQSYSPSCSGAGDGWITAGPELDPNDEYVAPAEWTTGATDLSISRLVIEIAGNSNDNAFGLYSLIDPTITLEIFGGADGGGEWTVIEYTTDGLFKNVLGGGVADLGGPSFGFYLDGPGGTFYSDSSLNPNGDTQLVAFQGGGRSVDFLGSGSSPWLENEWLLSWEDLVYANSDADFNDFVVLVESVTPVPEPGTLALLGAGLLGLGYARRRRA